jgi:homoserine O-acetyltransferase
MTKTLDYFDPASEYNDDLALALARTDARFMVISFTSDWRFSPERSHEIVRALLRAEKQLSYIEIDANQGHDAFLIPIPHYMNVFSSHMKTIADELPGGLS